MRFAWLSVAFLTLSCASCAEPAAPSVEIRPERVFSLLVSKNGTMIYRYYAPGVSPDDAHYVMSITKSVTSALVGIAIGEGKLPAPETSLAKVFPGHERFRPVTIKDLLGMSALDALTPPHRTSPADYARFDRFIQAPNRLDFALEQPLLAEPGKTFQYTDIGPQLAIGMLTIATQETALEYANSHLFGPLGFEHQEWMHEDSVGFDNGAFGLRLRPIDMQKFGILYLNGGRLGDRQLIPEDWVKTSFTPWTGPRLISTKPIYGWYWWQQAFGPGWLAHIAIGWRGQRIAVIPEQGVVVTMTGSITDHEHEIFDRLMLNDVIPALTEGRPLRLAFAADLSDVPREQRPATAPFETHHGYRP